MQSTAKVEAVQKLLNYWMMKTDLLKKREDPTLFAQKEIQEKAKKYLTENSDLNEYQFWNMLSDEAQSKAMQCFAMQEIQPPAKEKVSGKELKAAIYVVLSGSATVKNSTGRQETRYGPGQLFGAIDQFNQVAKRRVSFQETIKEREKECDDVIEFDSGTFMRLELKDLYGLLRGNEDEDTTEEETRELDAEIAGINWEDLTDDDKFYIRVYKRCKTLMNKNFFSFLDSYRMVPKNATMPAYRYYNEGALGREVYLDERDPTWVFVIIDGSMRVELCLTHDSSASEGSEKKKSNTLSCNRKGRKSMHVKVRMHYKSIMLLLLKNFDVI